eukprot:TRINITY_DN4666_c1_g1_i1.p1 TRINITY_DN4666_c1_g1~~TRINITY_DN4666_c1_g1_i1.p1  ORF type:complete len:554 (+),score=94.99 TRINITY_DN4666_c1_g1_i1:91-1752(+)
MAAGFSASLKLTDMDYIAPSQACILPLAGDGGGSGEVVKHAKTQRKEGPAQGKKVEITLADCLACSGCVTTAETMLVQEQSTEKLLAALAISGRSLTPPLSAPPLPPDAPKPSSLPRRFVVSVSPASASSVAASVGCSVQEAMQSIRHFFLQRMNCDDVVDLHWAETISLLETAAEFSERLKAQTGDGSQQSPPLPLVVSACPGVVCYVEKTEPKLLPHLSTAQSAQTIQGRVVKEYAAQKWGLSPEEVYHVTVQPCYDKKLEASRGEFTIGQTRWVDLVLATHELTDLLGQVFSGEDSWKKAVLASASNGDGVRESSLADMQGADVLRVPHRGSDHEPLLEGSGGYHQVALWNVARTLYGAEIQRGDFSLTAKAPHLEVKQRRPNFMEYTLSPQPGSALQRPLRFAVCYGFQNIRNLVRTTRTRPALYAQYDFIEVMACPDGCLNGGGQVRVEAGESNRQLLSRIQALHHTYMDCTEAASTDAGVLLLDGAQESRTSRPLTVRSVYLDIVKGAPGSARAHELFHARWQDHSKKKVTDGAADTPAASLSAMQW